MKKYFSLYNIYLKVSASYKADYFIHIAINLTFFYIFFALWKTIYLTNGTASIDSYSLGQTITYYFITSFIFRFDLSGVVFLNWDVWNGTLTNDLIRPWNAKISQLVATLSEITMNVLTYLPFWFFIYLTAKNYIAMPSGANFLYFLITLFLVLFMNIAFNLIFHCLSFYYGDQESIIDLINYIAAAIGGGVFPLAFLPGAAHRIFEMLPFRFLFDVPTNIFLGKIPTAQIFSSWLQIILWAIAFYAVFALLYQRGLKRYTGVGR
jgi:ABC-2 type transport system permease protein